MKVFTKILVIFAVCLAGSSCTELKAYPLEDGFIASLFIEPTPNDAPCTNQPETVVILDRSGSMGTSVRQIVTLILPQFFAKLNYSPNDMIHLITFSNDEKYYHMKIQDLTKLTTFDQNGTYMMPAVVRLKQLFEDFQKNEVEALRLLTISDGIIAKQNETVVAADDLADFAKNFFPMAVNSQAVRWREPTADTRALSSLLQLNNVKRAEMVDSFDNVTNTQIAEQWANLFYDDGLCNFQVIVNSEPIFLVNPWDTQPQAQLRLANGDNTIWMTSLPTDAKIDGAEVEAKQLAKPSNYRIYQLLKDKYEYFVNKVMILKVVNTPASLATIDTIVNYFKALDEEIPPAEGVAGFSDLLETIATDESTATMTPEELSEYLNQMRVDVEPPAFIPDESEVERDDLWSTILLIFGKQ